MQETKPAPTTLGFRETGFFSGLICDYLDNKSNLAPYYQYRPQLDAFDQVIADREKVAIDRDTLVKQLHGQYAGLSAVDAKVTTNIEALGDANTFTVTTGHQLGIFTGPLYFVHKIVSTINLAKQLATTYPEKHFVPVFWMASEDHDFDEISKINVFNREWKWEQEQAGPVGRISPEGLLPFVDELAEIAGDRPTAAEVVNLFREAYGAHATLAEATRYIVNALFGTYGLVVVDGDDQGLKRAATSVFEAELFGDGIIKHVENASEALVGLGYKAQVYPREINLFYIEDGVRERIVKEGDDYLVNNTDLRFTSDELKAVLENNPEKISPNAILRPAYQEKILPNLTYIGGGGELAYWFQLKNAYQDLLGWFPMLLLRNSVLFVDAGSQKKLQKLELHAHQLFQDIEALVKAYVQEHSSGELSLTEEREKFTAIYGTIAEKAGAIDPTLAPAIQGELQRLLKSVEGMEKRMVKAEKRNQETSINQIRGVHNRLFPNGHLQERKDNVVPFLLKYGTDFIEQLVQELEPLKSEFTVVYE